MKIMRLASRTFLETIRDPLPIVLGIGLPVCLFLLFAAIGAKVPSSTFTPEVLAPGVTVFSHSFLIMFVAMMVTRDVKSGYLDRIRTTPVRGVEILLGYLIPFLPFAVLQVIACAVAQSSFAPFPAFGVLKALPIYLTIALFCSSLGVLLGISFNENQIAGIGSLIVNIAGILGGAWLDLDFVGGFVREIGYSLPFANAVMLARGLATANASIMRADQAVILLLWTSFAVLACSFRFKFSLRR